MTRLAVIHPAHIHVADAARVLLSRPEVEVVGILDDDPSRGQRWTRELGAPFASTWDALFEAGVEACLVYGPTSKHVEHVETATGAGLATFVEKPLALEPHDARRLAARLDRRSQVGFFLRYCAAIEQLARLAWTGSLGPVHTIRTRFVHDGWEAGWFGGEHAWMADPAEGGGGYFDLAAHCVDLLTWIGGPVVRVVSSRLTGRHHGVARMDLPGEVNGELEAGWGADGLAIEVELLTERHKAFTRGGCLYVDNELVLDGEPPSAGHAVDVWLDHLVGREDRPLIEPEAAARNAEILDEMATATHAGAPP